MKHVFLTGEIQIGKSTVIDKTLALLNIPYGGFKTYFGPDRSEPERLLYLREAASPPVHDAEHAVVRFRRNAPPQVMTERFDTLGVSYIAGARGGSRLIVMDECGSLEREAVLFRREILSALDGDEPVLGVVKFSAKGWVDTLRYHPSVTLITVNAANRDALPHQLIDLLSL